ncbi:hypothetical protein BDY17DRAFT_326523 [Neohortaea acidophila]|uniref:Uncharacterized protein n=1 Tax=Neohortaea acidophila TaxID=245834 RepID=A0A6A6PKN4_9PEZI|nr:uncharacterized protein BDY17DRAFT_326523 [Neohortaea acidophila]KAF2480638.1 hypothetical protein BDY17DRAFT_326523 [Neohortaea acidophila]
MAPQQPQPESSRAPKLKDPPRPVREQIARVLLEKGPNTSQGDIGSHRNNQFYADKVRARPEYIQKWQKRQQAVATTIVVPKVELDQLLDVSATLEAIKKEEDAADASTFPAASSFPPAPPAFTITTHPNAPTGGNDTEVAAPPSRPSTSEVSREDASIALHACADEFKGQIRELANRRVSALGDVDRAESEDVARMIPVLRTAKDNALVILEAALDDFVRKHSDAVSQLQRIPVGQCKDFVNAWTRESRNMWSTLTTRLALLDSNVSARLQLDQIERRAAQPRLLMEDVRDDADLPDETVD